MRLAVTDVEALMSARPPGTSLEEALEVFEVGASAGEKSLSEHGYRFLL